MNKIITNIVFTKNRPLQLEGYLRSLYKNFPAELIQTYIIYKVELFGDEYKSLFQKYSDCIVVEETDFHTDFLNIINNINTKYTLFGIDDVVYFDSVDFDVIEKTFSKYPDNFFGFSLRFSKDSLKDGNDFVDETTIADQTVYSIDWTKGQTPNTRYPFELCATIYPSALVKKVINNTMNNNLLVRKLFSPKSILIKSLGKVISTRSILKSFGYFFNPNTLESWNCRWCQKHSEQLPHFFYFQKLCASAIQVNMVNTSTDNSWDGTDEHTVEALNEKYKQGYRLDINSIANNKPTETDAGQDHFKLTINQQEQLQQNR